MSAILWNEGRAIQSLYYALRTNLLVALPRFTPMGWYEADLWAVSKSWRVHEFEIKLSLGDFRADARKGAGLAPHPAWDRRSKHELLAAQTPRGPNRFTFVVPESIARSVRDELPAWAGLAVLRADRSDVCLLSTSWAHDPMRELVRRAPLLHPNRVGRRTLALARRALTYRFWTAHGDLVYRGECEALAASTTPAQLEESA